MRFAAEGWEHAGWTGGFYPHDLPEDWRLSYYANEFSSVWVPAAAWQGDLERLSDWCEEVSASFRFWLERPSEWSAEDPQGLPGQLAGWVVGVGMALREGGNVLPRVRFEGLPPASGIRLQWGEGAPVARVALGGRVPDPRQLRGWIEASHQRLGADAWLFFQGGGEVPETLRRAATIAGLLGLG